MSNPHELVLVSEDPDNFVAVGVIREIMEHYNCTQEEIDFLIQVLREKDITQPARPEDPETLVLYALSPARYMMVGRLRMYYRVIYNMPQELIDLRIAAILADEYRPNV